MCVFDVSLLNSGPRFVSCALLPRSVTNKQTYVKKNAFKKGIVNSIYKGACKYYTSTFGVGGGSEGNA